jgi:putative methyltransferase (TIGR04325 family)
MFKRAQQLLRRLFIGSGVTGVYPNYAAALAAVPKNRKVGYNKESSNLYPYLLEFTKISDFAALFYLSQLARPGYRIFDFGANIGVLFYNYQRRWTIPPDVTWTVCDVPAVIEAGREYARTHPSDASTSPQTSTMPQALICSSPPAPCSMSPRHLRSC